MVEESTVYTDLHQGTTNTLMSKMTMWKSRQRYMLGGSMRACHAAGPGSIPGRDKLSG